MSTVLVLLGTYEICIFIFLDSAWSGSLRPTGHKMSKGGNRGQDQNDGKSPWAGSLRHVNPNAQKKKKQKKEDGKLSYTSNHLF